MTKADRRKMEIKGDPNLECRTKVEFIESYIKIGNSDYKWNDNHGELIRCKDCKHLLEHDTGELECEIKSGWFPVTPKWYCADGERK